MSFKDSFEEIFGDKERVLIVLGHPDDNEIICGGIVARLISEGKKARSISMTNGGKGFQNRTDTNENDFSEIRKTEQLEAGKELGLIDSEIFNLDIPDGELENSLENIEKIVFHIRQFKPDIIITQNPFDNINTFDSQTHWVNHRDHRHTALLTIDAAYPYSRDRGFFPEHFEKYNLEPHTVSEMLFSDAYSYPDVSYFDITNFIDKKKNALLKHRNAFGLETVEEEFIAETEIEPEKNYERLIYYKI